MSDSILPPNATRAELACERAIAAMRPDLTPVAALMNPDTCPKHLLPWLAWALSVDFWDSGWSEETKRASVCEAVGIHRVKGTLQSVQRALKAAGYGDAIVREAKDLPRLGFIKPLGRDWTLGTVGVHWADYWVEISQPITRVAAQNLLRILSAVAPARCRLRAIDVGNIQYVLGRDDWSLGANIPLGGTFKFEVING